MQVTPIDFATVIVKIMTLMGIILSILGFLYLSFDILNREQAVLARFLQVATPVILATLFFGAVGIWYYRTFYGDYPLTDFGGILLYVFTGVLIGLFNGLFVQPHHKAKPFFAIWHAIAGVGITFATTWAGTAALLIVLSQPIAPAFIAAGILAPIGGVFAGFWRVFFARLSRKKGEVPFFSWRGLVAGLIASLLFGLFIVVTINVVTLVAQGAYSLDVVKAPQNSLLPASQFAIAGGITGAFAGFYYWANTLKGNQLGLVGFGITLVGFAFQIGEPIVSLMQQFVR